MLNAKQVEDAVRCYNMDGGEFFRRVVREAYHSPFRPTSKPRVSANKAAKLARQEREARKASGLPPTSSSTSAPPEEAATSPLGHFIDHFVMNLPATAIDLLGCFQGIYKPLLGEKEESKSAFYAIWKAYSEARGTKEGNILPFVHCYCFTKEVDDYERDICEVGAELSGTPELRKLNFGCGIASIQVVRI